MTVRLDLAEPQRLRSGHGAKWTAVPDGVLPAWVADMDFGIAPVVADAMRRTIERGDLGYPYWAGGDPVVDAFTERMQARFGWTPPPERTRVFSDLIQILQIVIEYATAPGDGVALHVPNYPPFLAAIHRAGRRPIPLRFTDSDDGWRLDLQQHHDAFERADPRLLVVVNPHNPTGRVLHRTELHELARFALDRGIPVFADEIHADLVYAPHTHTPLASLGADIAALTITATSATKAFNLAGTRCAVAHFGHEPTADALARAPLDFFGTPSVLSRIATVAAWRHADDWRAAVLQTLAGNRRRIGDWAAAHPAVRTHLPEGTYLSWLDFGATAIGADPAARLLDTAAVQLSPGAEFTQHTAVDTRAYARLNYATTPALLDEILGRIGRAL